MNFRAMDDEALKRLISSAQLEILNRNSRDIADKAITKIQAIRVEFLRNIEALQKNPSYVHFSEALRLGTVIECIESYHDAITESEASK